jgi:hypothetical protein
MAPFEQDRVAITSPFATSEVERLVSIACEECMSSIVTDLNLKEILTDKMNEESQADVSVERRKPVSPSFGQLVLLSSPIFLCISAVESFSVVGHS